MALPLVIDTDPGIDDAIAILLALASPEVDVRALTTVAGNVPLAQGSANARAVLALAGRGDVPVAPGAAAPLRRPAGHATEVDGEDGLGGSALPRPTAGADETDAPTCLAEAVRAAPGRLTLAAIGPLTNLALFVDRFPDLAARFGRVVVMGGGWNAGNVTAAAEFNAWVDPEALEAVLASGLRPDLVALETTRQARLEAGEIGLLRKAGPIAAEVASWLDQGRGQDGRSAPIHDALVIAALVRPGLLSFRDVHVTVDCGTGERRGETRISTNEQPNARIATGCDRAGFATLLVERLLALDGTRQAGL